MTTAPAIIVGVSASYSTRSGVDESAFRTRMLTGLWMTDLINEIIRQLGTTRRDIIGPGDLSRNALLRIVSRLAICHQPPPLTTGLDPEMADLIGDFNGTAMREDYAKRGSGGAPLPSRLCQLLGWAQRVWLAENEAGVAVTWGDDRPIVQVITSDLLRGLQDSEAPGQPVLLGWQRMRLLDGREWIRCWDTWDIRNPAAPTFQIFDGDWLDGDVPTGADVTERALDSEARAAVAGYPWRWTQGDRKDRPFIPVRVYHRLPTSALFDRDSGAELAQGTLTVAVLWSYWKHLVQDASWPQRWIENVEVAGAAVEEKDAGKGITTDAATVVQFVKIDPSLPAQIGQWTASSDPEVVGRAILAFEQALEAQLIPVDYSSTGGDPLARLDAARAEAIEQMYPICREHDSAVLEMIAAVCNRATGSAYPEGGYGLLYRDEIPERGAPPAPNPSPAPTGADDERSNPDDAEMPEEADTEAEPETEVEDG